MFLCASVGGLRIFFCGLLCILMDQEILPHIEVENMAELFRTIMERCGGRDSLQIVIVWLAACRVSLIQMEGVQLNQVFLSLDDLLVKSGKLRTLSAYWVVGATPIHSHEPI